MTYTVKNGTWCKDNDKEYYSTTKAGLKAALAAGEITAGTRVVVHEPKYNAGDIIKSMNPNCPEGCFVPNGQTFDTNIYEELAKVFPDGVLPDMRECVLVCAGRSNRPEITNHDEYSAGQFKNDTAAIPEHTHTVHVNDPGHGHSASVSISDPGHGHGASVSISDPGHKHSISDPGHSHSVSGSTGTVVKPGGVGLQGSTQSGLWVTQGSVDISGTAGSTGTGITIDRNTTGISASASVNGNTTGISASASVDGNTTGISVSIDPAAGAGDVTHGKQFGVYFYIAF